jgi:hypothetical protein
MQIPPNGSQASTTQTGTVGSASTERVNRPTAGTAPAESATRFDPTTDLSKYLQAVRELPDVRTDVVEEVAGRASLGDLQTQLAAQETAQAAIDDIRIRG